MRSHYALLALVLIGFTGSALLYFQARNNDIDRIRQELQHRAETRQSLIRANLNGYTESLYSLRNVVGAEPAIDRDAFRHFARDAMTRHRGFLAIAWIPLQPALFRSRPAFYLEAEAGLSFDRDFAQRLLADEFQRARETGELVASGQLDLPTGSDSDRCLALVCPVFPVPDHDKSAGSKPLVGFVVALFRTGDILGQTWRWLAGPASEVMFLDSSASDPERRLLFHYAADATDAAGQPPTEKQFRSGWFREMPLTVGGRDWLILYRARAGWFEQQRTAVPGMLCAGGITITLLFAAYLRSAVKRADLIEREVAERTLQLRAIQNQLEEDIRYRQQAEERLRASEQQLHGLMENSPGAIFFKDTAGRYLAVNRRFAELHKRTREHFIGNSDFDIFPPEIAMRTRKSDTDVIASGHAVELEDSLLLADGSHTSIVSKFPLIDASGAVHGICGIATDITERKRAEAEIRESRRQLESLLGQLPGMAFRCINDGELTPVYVSRGALGLTGHSARDFIEKNVRLHEIIHPEDRERVDAAIKAATRKRRGFEVEYRILDRGAETKWVLERGQGVYDEDGVLLFIEGLAIDITQRKDAEAEKLLVERRLLEGQKLESIGVLAGGIAHDFNNLLTGIMGNANLAALEVRACSPVQQNLKQIETASQRAAELCQQMLAYAGKGRFVVQRVELGALVQNTVPLLRASISKRANLRFDLQPDLPPVLADPTQMRQIVMNLVLNASESLEEKDGDITIATTMVRPAPGTFNGAALAPPELALDFIRLQVTDTGCGMPAETIAKIFDPFFTTKFAGRGLGLAAVLGIIRSHRGGLIVASEPEKGSVFTIYLPADVSRPTEPAGIRRTAVSATWKQDGRALIVDDEEHVLKVASGMLRSCGLTVETANDGYEGLDVFRARPDEIDVVLLDMTMPHLSGEETLHLLREVKPEVRVLFMSGYNRREVVNTLAGRGALAFIQKPFTLESLREHLQRMLA